MDHKSPMVAETKRAESLERQRTADTMALGEISLSGHADEPAKSFSLLSTLGIQFSCTSTPIAIGTYLSLSIGVGGSPGYFFGYLVAAIFNLLVCASMAEISAVYPHSSGQIYWVSKLGPKKYARVASYITGWMAGAGWFFWCTATILITSQLTFALVAVCKATFIAQPWHYYLGFLAVGIFALLFNLPPFFKLYPYMLKGLVVYVNAGALFVLIVLLVRVHPKQSASFVFADFVNDSGWNSNGVVFFIGLLPGLTAVNGFDCAAHMAEELPDPERRVPQVMMGSAVLSALSGVPMTLVYMFCVVNSANLLAPVGGQPVIQLMLDSFDSLTLTIIGNLIFIIVFFCASIAELTVMSRVWWSLAREGGMPFSKTMSRLQGKSQLPVNAVFISAAACAVVGTIQLGSSIALNAILGTGVICIFVSYTMPIAALLYNRRAAFPAKRYFNLGKSGFYINVISCLWMCMMLVWLFLPLYLPVTGSGMNYAVVVFVTVLIVSTLNWLLYSRKHFSAPQDMTPDVNIKHEIMIGLHDL